MSFDRDQLVKICGLFDSTNAGERANAALKATRLVRAAGKSWSDVIMPASYEERLSLALELQQRGWGPVAAAGLASVLNVPTNGQCPNLGNWHGTRWSQMLDFCSRSNHADHSTVKSQLDYLCYSLRGVYNGLTAKLNSAKTVAEAKKLAAQYLGGETQEVSQCKT